MNSSKVKEIISDLKTKFSSHDPSSWIEERLFDKYKDRLYMKCQFLEIQNREKEIKIN